MSQFSPEADTAAPLVSPAEAARLAALRTYALMDTPAESDFDDITTIASQICGTPISLISLIGETRVWFKSKVGLALSEAPREATLCSVAIQKRASLVYVPDLRDDPRFRDHPAVTGGQAVDAGGPLRFYAGVPLISPDGHRVGALCVADHRSRTLAPGQLSALTALAAQVMRQMELWRTVRLLRETQAERDAAYKELDAFAHIVAHDLKSPLNTIVSFHSLLSTEEVQAGLGEEYTEYMDIIGSSAAKLSRMIEGVLEYSRNTAKAYDDVGDVDVQSLIAEVLGLIHVPASAKVVTDIRVPRLRTHRVMLQQILQSLVSNAARYAAADNGRICIGFGEKAGRYLLTVADNGPGIGPTQVRRVFDLFYSNQSSDGDGAVNPDGTARHGIGLATVKRLVTRLGGSVLVESAVGTGSTFCVLLPKA